MQLFLALAALAGAALALPAADPAPPALTYLFTANLTVSKPISVGAGPQGSRQVVPITGGVFAGPKLSGVYLSPFNPFPTLSLSLLSSSGQKG